VGRRLKIVSSHVKKSIVGDIHQPLHAGKLEDRWGNLTCVSWMGESSQRVFIDGKASCTGTNLHAVWDSKLLEAATGFVHPDDALAFARQLRPLLQWVQAVEPSLRGCPEISLGTTVDLLDS